MKNTVTYGGNVLNYSIPNFLDSQQLQTLNITLGNSNNWYPTGGISRLWIFDKLPTFSEIDHATWLYHFLPQLAEQNPAWYQVFEKLQDVAGPRFKFLKYSINGHYAEQSYPVHRDIDQINGDHVTFLIYLNTEWQANWGGYTAFYDENNNITHLEIPEPGKLVGYNSKILHQGQGPTVPGIFRMTFAVQGMFE